MTPALALDLAINPALRLLPDRMSSREARVMLVAIALQESRLQHRAQIRGPARGYWQFERAGGVAGVLGHSASKPHIEEVCHQLDVPPRAGDCYVAIEYQDVLAATFARLLLWTLPQPLPTDADTAWSQYISAWRPGKPHPATWKALYAQAQEAVA